MMDPTAEIVKIPDGEGLFEIMPNPYVPDEAEKINYPQLGVRGMEIEGRNPAFVRGHVSVVRDNKEGVYVIVGEDAQRDLVKKILADISREGKMRAELSVRLMRARGVKTIDVVFIPHKQGVIEGDLHPVLICKGAPDFIMTARNKEKRTTRSTKDYREEQRRLLEEGVRREELEKQNRVTSEACVASSVDIIFAGSDTPFLTVRKV